MKTKIRKSSKGVVLAITVVGLSGCATAGKPLTTDQKIAGCGVTVLGGALIGGLVGDGEGALIGAGIGAGVCGVWLAFENEADKRRLAEAKLVALESGNLYSDSWQGVDGRVRSVVITPSSETRMVPKTYEAPTPQETLPDIEAETSGSIGAVAELAVVPETSRICRVVNIQAGVSGRTDTIQETWCRTDSGNYEPSADLMKVL